MAIEILMPALSPTMEKGNLTRWLVSEGDNVSSGDVIAEIETDKATMEVEAVDDGIMGKILVAGGTADVAVNSVIAVLLEEGESASDISVAAAPVATASQQADVASVVPTTSSLDVAEDTGGVSIVKHSGMITDPSLKAEETWTGATRAVTVREALCEAMAEEMRKDQDVFVIGEEVAEYQGAYKVTKGLLQEFGAERVVDTPITEYGFAGVGCGAAFMGLKPIVEFMSFNFSLQAIDHVLNSAAKTLYMSGGQVNVPIVFRGPNGAASRVAAQHSQCFASWYAHCPGLKVIAPYSAADAKGLLKSAILDPNPVVFLENELLYGETFDIPDTDNWIVPIGKAKTVRPGRDVTIVTFSIMVGKSLQAAEELAKEGVEAEVIDLRTLRPLDLPTIMESVKRTNRLIVVEEGWPYAGIGSSVSALIMENAFDYLDAPVLRVAGKDVLLPYAANIEQEALPQIADIIHAVKKVCYR